MSITTMQLSAVAASPDKWDLVTAVGETTVEKMPSGDRIPDADV